MAQVLFFANLREKIGADRLEINQAVTVGELKKLLINRYPDLAVQFNTSLIAVNQNYATDDTSISLKDEVAFIPPVSGG